MSNKKKSREVGKGLGNAISQLEKLYGKSTIYYYGDGIKIDVDYIPSGSMALNKALGVGGYPRGRIIEIYGPESSGKTTLALHAIAEAQKKGLQAAFVDAENALDINYAKNLGVNIKDLLLSQPDSGEQALNIVEVLVRSHEVGIVVIDSVAALVPQSEIDGDMGDAHMAAQARLMSQALRKLTSIVSKSNTLVVFINQIRSKIGVIFGNPETTSGGNALKFYASVRLDIRRKDAIKKDKNIVGNKTRVKVVKNKVAPPFREAFFNIMYGVGIDNVSELIDIAIDENVIVQSGAWYYLGKKKSKIKWNGRDQLVDTLMKKPKLLGLIRKKVTGEVNA